MDKAYIDELYHQLRLLYLEDNAYEKQAIAGLVSHLANPKRYEGDYTGLLRFLTYYGETFLLDKILTIIKECRLTFTRVVDLGAGFCWLGRGISNSFNGLPAIFVDKRQWPLIDIVADIESKNGRKRVLDEMKPGDLVVMGELLHCLDNPARVLRSFSRWPMVVVEYYPTAGMADYMNSYNRQIKCLDCKPISSIDELFLSISVKYRLFDLSPHAVVVAEPL